MKGLLQKVIMQIILLQEEVGRLNGEVGWVSDIAEASSCCAPAVYCHLHQHIREGGDGQRCGTCDKVRPGNEIEREGRREE